ncbi:hypothetical protein ERJ75_000222300 [Trypanosoma vivax]|nr:hypothetical protein ERJ75_000222300 [Trypanosoma vivax]
MVSAQVCLQNVLEITPSSVLLLPNESQLVDFQTISNIPYSHREVVQRNGLVAKLMLSVTSRSGTAKSYEERFNVWQGALSSVGLIDPGSSGLSIPAHLSHVMWPVMDEETLSKRIELALKHKRNEKVSECPYILPILHVQHIFYTFLDVKGTLGIVWFPRYQHNLLQWSRIQLPHQHISEVLLRRIINNVVCGIFTLQDAYVECPLTICPEDILVGEKDESTLVFLLNVWDCGSLLSQQRQAANSYDGSAALVAPELVNGTGRSPCSTACCVWSLAVVVYRIASGTLDENVMTIAGRQRMRRTSADLPLNHSLLRPNEIISRVRRSLQTGSYSNHLVHLLLLMLGQDPLTRPSPCGVLYLLQDLLRFRPILRFPFAIGPLSLLRLPGSDKVIVDATRHRYTTMTVCLLCHGSRCCAQCVAGEHTPALCSPLWSSDEPLPGYAISCRSHMTYLFPMLGRLELKDQRRCIDVALNDSEIDKNALLQLFGGFALVKIGESPTAVARDVLVPLPYGVLGKEERKSVVLEISFTAALPWPSCCTSQLQQQGRIQRFVPGIFSFSNMNWFSWILPGEKLELNGEPWVVAPDGAFVFWANENLQPSESDRYFMVCSLPSLTLQTEVRCNVLPDNAFKRRNSRNTSSTENNSINYINNEVTPAACTKELARSGNYETRSERHPELRASNASLINASKTEESAALIAEANKLIRRSRSAYDNTATSSNGATHSDDALAAQRRPVRRSSAAIRMDYVDELSSGVAVDDVKSYRMQRGLSSEVLSGATGENCKSRGNGSFINDKEEKQPNGSTVPSNRQALRSKEQRGEPMGETKNPHTPTRQRSPAPYRHTQPVYTKSPVPRDPRPNSGAERVESRVAGRTGSPPIQVIRPTQPRTYYTPRIFGRWYSPQHVDAVYQSLTFCIPQTGEHGTLSIPVMLSLAVRTALYAPATATSMAFCANMLPLIKRNHPMSVEKLKMIGSKEIIPHHALVFYDDAQEVVGLLALRFAVTSSPDISAGEMLLPTKLLPPVPTTAALTYQLNAAYFTGNAVFNLSPPRRDVDGVGRPQVVHPVTPSGTPPSTSMRLTFSAAGFASYDDPRPTPVYHDDEALPYCWVGFENESRMLMLSDVQRLAWHPLYFTDE